ncbi:cysteine-rich KTR domain-containing protein [Anaerotruncus colihominis]
MPLYCPKCRQKKLIDADRKEKFPLPDAAQVFWAAFHFS